MLIVTACKSQNQVNVNQHVGGPCEGCEAVFEYNNKTLSSTATLPKFQESEIKLKISGTVYHKDGTTPAKDVILYIYHTNREGVYETNGLESGWAKRHGYIRGWIKTGNDGKYAFYTFRPASYPDREEPEHIHLTVKEPNRNEYYIDEYVFDDDLLLTESHRKKLNNRGGSGIASPVLVNNVYAIERDIILGLNIPNYE